jgi:hypothetical protein
MIITFGGTSPLYSLGFSIFQPSASDANPLGNGLVTDASQIRFSLDIKTIGNVTTQPVRLSAYQSDAHYEADRGIDANNDGDMTDSATVFRSAYAPILLDGGDFTHVSYTLDQGQLTASILRSVPFEPSTSIPLTPQFDPTVSLTLAFGGMNYDTFGPDTGNAIVIDNIQIEVVPEPNAILLILSAACCVSVMTARRHTHRLCRLR